MFAKDFGEMGLREFRRTPLSQGIPYAAVFPSRPRRLGTSANRSTRSLDLRAETCGSRGIGRVSAYSNIYGKRSAAGKKMPAGCSGTRAGKKGSSGISDMTPVEPRPTRRKRELLNHLVRFVTTGGQYRRKRSY
jgi:hypothetical protein